MRVAMLVSLVTIHQAALNQIADDMPIRVFEIHTAEGRYRIDETAGFVHGDQHRQIMLAPGRQVINAVGGRRMHNAGTVSCAHVIRSHDVCVILLDWQKGVERLVAPAHQLAAPEALDDPVFFGIS